MATQSFTVFTPRTPFIDKPSYLYKDEGCDISSACLECPLAACKDDDPAAYVAYKREKLHQEILTTIKLKMPRKYVMKRFGISERTYYRLLGQA